MFTQVSTHTCHDCGLLQTAVLNNRHQTALCNRCHAVLVNYSILEPKKRMETILALAVTATILLIISLCFPILKINFSGSDNQVSIFGCAIAFYNYDMTFISLLIIFTGIISPSFQILYAYIYCFKNNNFLPKSLVYFFSKHQNHFSSWSMLDVFFLSIIITAIKLVADSKVYFTIGTYAVFLFVIVLTTLNRLIDTQKTVTLEKEYKNPKNLQYSKAFLWTATLLLIPANTIPIMIVTNLGKTTPDTIISGIIRLAKDGSWFIASVILIASVFVPFIKLMILFYLIYFNKIKRNLKTCTKLYRLSEFIGKWSMVDIYVTALMAALIQFNNIATVAAGYGAFAFGLVIIFTILSVEYFDAHLIWESKKS